MGKSCRSGKCGIGRKSIPFKWIRCPECNYMNKVRERINKMVTCSKCNHLIHKTREKVLLNN